MKIFRANSVFQGKRKLLKNLKWWKYILNTVNSGYTLFFTASASCSKILNVKSIFNTVKNVRANFVFQGKSKVAQKSWMVENIFNTVKHFRANSVFQGKRSLLKDPERWKFFQYSVFSVYSLGDDQCNSDRTFVQYCTWYNQGMRIRYNTRWHTGTCILSACFISRGAIFSWSGPHGHADCLAPLSAHLKCLAQEPSSRCTVTFNHCVAPWKSRTYLHLWRQLS